MCIMGWFTNLFKRKYPKIIDEVNTLVNSNIKYKTDVMHYGITDVWIDSPVDGMGDCEDFALTKKSSLILKGIPPEDLSIFTCRYVTPTGYQDHAVLLYKTTWVLDNRTDIIWKKEQTQYTNWAPSKNRKIYVGQID